MYRMAKVCFFVNGEQMERIKEYCKKKGISVYAVAKRATLREIEENE